MHQVWVSLEAIKTFSEKKKKKTSSAHGPADVTSSSMNENMAASMELRCWGGGWGLPSVHAESLVVLVTL